MESLSRERSSATAASSSWTRAASQPSPSSTSPVTRAVAAASGVLSSCETELTSVVLSRSASRSASACAASSSRRWRSSDAAARFATAASRRSSSAEIAVRRGSLGEQNALETCRGLQRKEQRRRRRRPVWPRLRPDRYEPLVVGHALGRRHPDRLAGAQHPAHQCGLAARRPRERPRSRGTRVPRPPARDVQRRAPHAEDVGHLPDDELGDRPRRSSRRRCGRPAG